MVAVVGGSVDFSISDSTEFLHIGDSEISEETSGESFGNNLEEMESSGAVEEGSELSSTGKASFLKKYSKNFLYHLLFNCDDWRD